MTQRGRKDSRQSGLIAGSKAEHRTGVIARSMHSLRDMTCAVVFVVTLGAAHSAHADLSPIPDNTWVTNGAVNAITVGGNTVYIGGTFTEVGPRTGPGVGISAVSGADLELARISTSPTGTYNQLLKVNAVVADKWGGWYVGGFFAEAGGSPANSLVHILADGTVDPHFHADEISNDGATPTISALALSGNYLYVAGAFNEVAGHGQTGIAALDAVTGAPVAWNPGGLGATALAVSGDGSIVFAGGYRSLRAISSPTGLYPGQDLGFPVDTEGVNILAFAVSGNTLYVCGWPNATGLAAIDIVTRAVTPLTPDPAYMGCMALAAGNDGTTLYVPTSIAVGVGGDTHVQTVIAAIDVASGATLWQVTTNDHINALAVSVDGNLLYMGGYFTEVGDQQRNSLAALDARTGAVDNWDPHADGGIAGYTETGVSALAVSFDAIYAGGTFGSINAVSRQHLAAIDRGSGRATDWNPGVSYPLDGSQVPSQIFAMTTHGHYLYVGGYFGNIGGQSRANLAAFDANTGALVPWNPGVDYTVTALGVHGSNVYVAGSFTQVGGQPRNSLAAVDAEDGTVTDWNSDNALAAPFAVQRLVTSGDRVYVSGSFGIIGGQPRPGVAALDGHTGAVTDWNPEIPSGWSQGLVQVNTSAFALSPDGITAYIAYSTRSCWYCRDFRNFVAAFDAATGQATGWQAELGSDNPDYPNYLLVDPEALAVSADSNSVYIGGTFQSVEGQQQPNLAALSTTTGTILPWAPLPGGYDGFDLITTLLPAANGTLYVGGAFTDTARDQQAGFASFSPSDDGNNGDDQ